MSPIVRRINLEGQRFGKLKVINYAGKSSGNYRGAMWNCECTCGKLVVVRSCSLRSGRTKSCGCGVVEASKARAKSIEGKKFGRLLVLREVERRGKHRYWACQCDCGKTHVARGDSLTSGKVISCGCFNLEKSTTHGESHTRLFQTYQNMIFRCYDPKNVAYHNYGGRGISVCAEWRGDFRVFKVWASSNGYNDTLLIDRINNDCGYHPNNCRWVERKVSGSNRRNVKMINFNGDSMHLSDWSKYLGVNRKTLFNRLYKLDWNVEEAFTVPIGERRRRVSR